ncbi:molybdenum cofactor biosynthesis protein MoaE [bacterium]|jgi:molybdopterin synthase catalytic subunit|nr:molybdenum cofactor biosynthesis protein MoaE [bacterium]
MNFTLTAKPINETKFIQELTSTSTGALVEFKGIIRDINLGKQVETVTYEAYDEMVNHQAQSILENAKKTFDIQKIKAIHRTGTLKIGEIAIWVGVSAMHRKEAFHACEHVMNQFKKDLPIWKKEAYTDSESEWVRCSCSSQK